MAKFLHASEMISQLSPSQVTTRHICFSMKLQGESGMHPTQKWSSSPVLSTNIMKAWVAWTSWTVFWPNTVQESREKKKRVLAIVFQCLEPVCSCCMAFALPISWRTTVPLGSSGGKLHFVCWNLRLCVHTLVEVGWQSCRQMFVLTALTTRNKAVKKEGVLPAGRMPGISVANVLSGCIMTRSHNIQ